MIDGRTNLVGLIGWPVQHSLSPAMHNAAFEALGLNWRYVPLPVRPGAVEAAVRGLAALGFRGANVTVPHKRAVMSAVDHLAPVAAVSGAVNTLVVRSCHGQSTAIHGHNTDIGGFLAALHHGGFRPQAAARAVVVGAGGAARAVVCGLLGAGVQDVVVLNRTLENAQALVAHLTQGVDAPSTLRAQPLLPEALLEVARAADLLVNATTVGMSPHTEQSVWPVGVRFPAQLTVFDLVYNPLQTRLLQQARESGAQTIDGLGMLVHQGALAFEMWTGRPAPADIMRDACERVLGR